MYKFSLAIYLFYASVAVLANSAPEPTKAVEGAVEVKQFSGQQNEKWAEVQMALGNLKTKVDAQAKVVLELLSAKKENSSKISTQEIENLKKEHAKLQRLTIDYNEMLADFQFRFPEKGLESGRKYIRLENQTIEQMENAPTFEGRLKRLNRKIKKQYQVDEGPKKNTKPSISPSQVSDESKFLDEKKSSDIEVTDQINLVK